MGLPKGSAAERGHVSGGESRGVWEGLAAGRTGAGSGRAGGRLAEAAGRAAHTVTEQRGARWIEATSAMWCRPRTCCDALERAL